MNIIRRSRQVFQCLNGFLFNKIETFNEILNTFENDTNILLLAHGSEDSLKSFALHIKPLLESFEEWVSTVHTHTPLKFFRKNMKLVDRK